MPSTPSRSTNTFTCSESAAHHATLPPIVHAVGGSIGSILSLLALYPLERVRIEMQARVSNNANNVHSNSSGSRRGLKVDTENLKEKRVTQLGNFSSSEGGESIIQSADMKGDYEMSFSSSSSATRDGNSDGSYGSIGSSSIAECFGYNKNKSDDGISNNSSYVMSPDSSSEAESSSTNGSPSCTRTTTTVSPLPRTTSLQPSSKRKAERIGMRQTFSTLRQRNELYSGCQPVVFTLALSNFIFFYALQASKKLMQIRKSSNMDAAASVGGGASIIASSIAGVINVLLTNPLWVANLRIVRGDEEGLRGSSGCTKNTNNLGVLLSTVKNIVEREGVRQLWSGTWTSLLLVSNPAIQYYAYEKLKLELLGKRGGLKSSTPMTLSPLEAFVAGALAKALATVLTYPLQLAQVLIRLQKNRESSGSSDEENNVSFSDKNVITSSSSLSFQGTLDCIIQLYKRGGLRAVYSGIDAKLLQSVLTAALTFLTYEQILRIVSMSYSSFFRRKRLV